MKKFIALFMIIANVCLLNAADLIPYNKKGVWGYCDKSGNMVIAPQFVIASLFINNTAIVLKKNVYGVIDTKGNFIIKPEYFTLERIDNEYFVG